VAEEFTTLEQEMREIQRDMYDLEPPLEEDGKKDQGADAPPPIGGFWEGLGKGVASPFVSTYRWGQEAITGAKQKAADVALDPTIDPEGPGAPFTTRAVYTPGDENIAIATIRQMAKEHPEVQFKISGDPEKLFWRESPNVEKWNPVNPYGADWGDLAELKGYLPTIAGEILGAVAAEAVVKKFPPARWLMKGLTRTGGLGLGAAGGETARLNLAEGAGELGHLTDDQIREMYTWEPAKAASLAVAGGAAFAGIIKLAKLGKGLLTGNTLPRDFREAALGILDENPQIVTIINKELEKLGSNKQFMPNSAQLVNDPNFMGAIVRWVRTPEGRKVAENLDNRNYDAIEELYSHYVKSTGMDPVVPATGGATGISAGKEFSEVIDPLADAAEDTLLSTATKAGIESDEIVSDITTAAGRVSGAEVGKTIRAPADAVEDALRSPVHADPARGISAREGGEVIQEMLDASADATKRNIRVRPAKAGAKIDEIVGKLNNDIAPQLADNKPLFKELNEAFTGVLNANRRLGQKQTFSFEQTERLLRALRKTKDHLIKQNRSADDVMAAERFLLEDTFDALGSKSPALQKRYFAAQKKYANYRTMQGTGVISKLLSKTGKQRSIQDTAVFSTVFGPDKTTLNAAENMLTVLADPKFVGKMDNVLTTIRQGINAEFLRDNAERGVINSTKASKWLNDRKEILNLYLEPDQLSLLMKAKGAATTLEGALKAANKSNLKRAVNSLPGAKAMREEKNVFDKLMGDSTLMKEAQDAFAETFPIQWKGIKEAALNRFQNQVMEWNPVLRRKVFSFEKLRNVLDESVTKNEHLLANMRTLFGDEYVTNLSKIRDAVEMLQRSFPGTMPASENKFFELAKHMWFGPLTRWGFRTRKAQAFVRGEMEAALMRKVLDPKALNAAARSTSVSEAAHFTHRQIGAALAQATDFTENLPPEMDLRSKAIGTLRKKLENDPELKEKLENVVRNNDN